jgi:hypothetical protein
VAAAQPAGGGGERGGRGGQQAQRDGEGRGRKHTVISVVDCNGIARWSQPRPGFDSNQAIRLTNGPLGPI